MNKRNPNGIELAQALRSGSIRALARLISLVENRHFAAEEAIRYLYSETGNAYILGVTGPAGSGKSTLVDRLACRFRRQNLSLGILACDPTSPFSGGAILGDRLRMENALKDPEVYIRSFGTRGHLGGLSRAAADAIHLLDAFGKDVIIVETVGVGQDEVDVAKMTDTCILVLVPGLGDEIQAMKAGIMEIGDIFVVNKADREGADRLVREIDGMLSLRLEQRKWNPPIVETIATQDEGIDGLLEAIAKHRANKERTGTFGDHRKERIRLEILKYMTEEVCHHIVARIERDVDFDKCLNEVLERKKDPATLCQELMWPITKLITE